MTQPSTLPHGVVRVRADLAPPTPKELAEAARDRQFVPPTPAAAVQVKRLSDAEIEQKRLTQMGFQEDGAFVVDTHGLVTVEDALHKVFTAAGAPRLGGASGTLGWSSFATFERCPYLWKRMYKDGLKGTQAPAAALEVGSLVHTFLAVHYERMIRPQFPLSSEDIYHALLDSGCSIQRLMVAYSYYSGYRAHYLTDCLIPLAVEHLAVDSKTSESCRYDLIARVDDVSKSRFPIVPGTYIVEHKTASRFDSDVLDGWRNDGEVLGQIMLWQRMNLDAVFGPLRGVMVNIIGKQKHQQFHRTVVSPSSWQTTQHGADLKQWHGVKQLMVALDTFPRARANCIGRYGKCSQYDHCSGDDGTAYGDNQ